MVQKVMGNFGWLVGEKGINLFVALIVNILLARHLGPEQFGLLSYSVAMVGLIGTFTYLGMSGIVVRDLVKWPEARDEILGTVFVLKLIGALLAIGTIGGIILLQVESRLERWVICVLSIGMVFQSVSVIRFWYQSRLEGKQTVGATIVASIAAAVTNVILILTDAPLLTFALVIVGQQAVTTIGFFYIYQSQGMSVSRWQFRLARAKSLLRESWPLILSAVGSLVYLKIDQVMLGHISSKEEVGIYAVAVTFSEVWYFIPTAMAASLFPRIIQLKNIPPKQYHIQMQRMYQVMVIIAICIAFPMTLFAKPVIGILYGPTYIDAAYVLMIHIWACPPVFMAAVLSKWLISEGLLIFSLTRNGLGAVANILLNLILIPPYGAQGAAVATVISYTLASYLACFTDRRTFITGILMTRALLMPLTGLWGSKAIRS